MKLFYMFFISVLLMVNVACASPSINIKLHVVDNNDQPVTDAKVVMSFLLSKTMNHVRGLTDADGFIDVTEEGFFGVGILAKKDGYYESKYRTGYGDQSLTLLLREKKNPIAMYAKKVNFMVEKVNKKYGFDFIAGDFIAPYGKGVHADMTIEFKRGFLDQSNYRDDLVMSFQNNYDGVRKAVTFKERNVSDFKSDYLAPIDGYEKSMMFTSSRANNVIYKQSNKNEPLYLRIRSIVKDDEVTSAQYCKVWTGVDLYGAFIKTPGVKFSYHCNPIANDRNVEFSGKSLFENLSGKEQVREF